MMARVVSLRIPDLMNAELRNIGPHNTVEVEPDVYELVAKTNDYETRLNDAMQGFIQFTEDVAKLFPESKSQKSEGE